jgi:phosphotransacetylase
MFVCCLLPLQTYPAVDKYVERLLEARKGKNLTSEVAYDAVTNDVNMFGVMMVAAGEAAGMVSGAIHTTAATIRPAMQVGTRGGLTCGILCALMKTALEAAAMPAATNIASHAGECWLQIVWCSDTQEVKQ